MVGATKVTLLATGHRIESYRYEVRLTNGKHFTQSPWENVK